MKSPQNAVVDTQQNMLEGKNFYSSFKNNLEIDNKILFGEIITLFELSEIDKAKRDAFKQFLGRVISQRSFALKSYMEKRTMELFPGWELNEPESEPMY